MVNELTQVGLCLVFSAAAAWYAARLGIFGRALAGPEHAKRGRRAESIGREVEGVSAPIWFVCAAATFLAIPVGAGLLATSGDDFAGVTGSMQRRAMVAAGGFGAGALTALLLLYMLHPRLGPKSGGMARASDAGIGLWCIVLVAPVYLLVTAGSIWVSTHVFGVPPPTAAHEGLQAILSEEWGVWSWVFAFAAVVLTPLSEEFVYRVYLQGAMRGIVREVRGGPDRKGDVSETWWVVGITGVLFAVSHAGTVPWAAVPGLCVLAMGIGVCYEKTRRLGVPIVMHAVFNAVNLGVAVWAKAAAHG